MRRDIKRFPNKTRFIYANIQKEHMVIRFLLDEVEGHFLFRENVHAIHKFLETVRKMAAMPSSHTWLFNKKEEARKELKKYYLNNYFHIAESKYLKQKDKDFIKSELDPDEKISLLAKQKMMADEKRDEMSVQQIITTYVHRHKGELTKYFLKTNDKLMEDWKLAKDIAPKVKLDIQLLYPKIHNRHEMEWVEDKGQQQTIENDMGILFRALSGFANKCGIKIKGNGKRFGQIMYDDIMALLKGEEMALQATG